MSQDADNQEISKLLRALSEGDREAADVLVHQLTPLITRLVFRLTGWHADTQDLVQDVFLNIQRSWQSFQGQSQLQTWVTAIVLNRCRNWHRTQNRSPDRASVVVEELTDDRPPSGASLEDRESLRQALRSLNDKERELIVLRYLEEMDLEEMSRLTQVRRNTLEVRLHRARQKMLQAMSPASVENARG